MDATDGGPYGRKQMRCRHCNAEWDFDWEYCPHCHRNYGGAVCLEQKTQQEISDTERVVAFIQQAFNGVWLEDGTTIHEADLEGAYENDKVRLQAWAKDPEIDWKDIPDWKIERFASALNFFDPQGWRFYIPAYMCWLLKNWRRSDSQTVDSVIWGFEPRLSTRSNGIAFFPPNRLVRCLRF